MSAVIQLSQRRRVERKETHWDAIAILGDLVIRGTIRDFSRCGLFFEPDVSYNGAFVQGDDVLDELQAGDNMTLTILNAEGKPQLLTSMEVRWVGESRAHGCCGFGAELESSHIRLAA